MIGVYSHLLSKVFRCRYHSQKVIGSLGYSKKHQTHQTMLACFGPFRSFAQGAILSGSRVHFLSHFHLRKHLQSLSFMGQTMGILRRRKVDTPPPKESMYGISTYIYHKN